jgi:hypothetical protein
LAAARRPQLTTRPLHKSTKFLRADRICARPIIVSGIARLPNGFNRLIHLHRMLDFAAHDPSMMGDYRI